MKTEDKKAIVTAYKERKVEAGIYAVRCETSAEIWVGSASDLTTIQNRIWFTLRHGTNPDRSLQSAWNMNGADAFSFDVVEQLDEEAIRYDRNRLMRKHLDHWADQLGAVAI